MQFKLHSKYKPSGDQPEAIEKLAEGVENGFDKQTLLGVTGSGKTFTIANVIEKTQKPTLVIAHNKTLAAQLCAEFREFFPENAVEYFVSYYDYYQPEAYMPHTDTYIEKEAQINEEIERLRHACTQALLSRNDVIIVASVSAIYGLGSPAQYKDILLNLIVGQPIDRTELIEKLISMQFERTNSDLARGSFRIRGNTIEVMPMNEEMIYRLQFENTLESIERIHPVSRKIIENTQSFWLFPAIHFVVDEKLKNDAIAGIRKELDEQLKILEKKGKVLEYERLKRRVNYDLEMIQNIGYCSGIENYSRHFDGRAKGEPPFTLLDYFKEGPGKFLTVIDESHVTVSQIRGMYAGDQARKKTLVEHGFRLPSAKDNRPLDFSEFEEKNDQTIYVSATPGEFELKNSKQVVEQIVRPTGLIDPEVIIQPITGKNRSQIDDLIERIVDRVAKGERTLATTLTKRMAEDLTEFLKKKNIKVSYLHSDVETLDRVQTLTDLRQGKIDVIVGVNLLREGLDLPEVSLVAILDADKEGFLRNDTSLIQTIGRAARNVNGQVIMYADKITDSIKRAISETDRRRKIQLQYNLDHGITPKTIDKAIKNILEEFGLTPGKSSKTNKLRKQATELDLLGDGRPMKLIIKEKEAEMKESAKNLEFETAAILRDEIRELKMSERLRD
jgi:excinuclease ABC subunit B